MACPSSASKYHSLACGNNGRRVTVQDSYQAAEADTSSAYLRRVEELVTHGQSVLQRLPTKQTRAAEAYEWEQHAIGQRN